MGEFGSIWLLVQFSIDRMKLRRLVVVVVVGDAGRVDCELGKLL